jgi:hypothetical protein
MHSTVRLVSLVTSSGNASVGAKNGLSSSASTARPGMARREAQTEERAGEAGRGEVELLKLGERSGRGPVNPLKATRSSSRSAVHATTLCGRESAGTF